MCCSFSELHTDSSSRFGPVEDFPENAKPLLPFCSSLTDSSLPRSFFGKIQDNYKTKLGAIKAAVKPAIEVRAGGGGGEVALLCLDVMPDPSQRCRDAHGNTFVSSDLVLKNPFGLLTLK